MNKTKKLIKNRVNKRKQKLRKILKKKRKIKKKGI